MSDTNTLPGLKVLGKIDLSAIKERKPSKPKVKTAPVNKIKVPSNATKNADLRRLYRIQKGLCAYCRNITELPISGVNYCPAPSNLATIDHVWSKNDIRRFIETNARQKVLSCYRCNQDKNEGEVSIMNADYEIIIGDAKEINLTELLTTKNKYKMSDNTRELIKDAMWYLFMIAVIVIMFNQ